jgi:glycerol-3-phosphate acyltransferase PlsX
MTKRRLGRLPSPKSAAVSIVEAPQTVAMDEHPAQTLKHKPNSSIAVGINMVKRGEADAFVCAGNTGAIAAWALFSLGMLEGIERPAIGSIFFTSVKQRAMILDIGATAECKPIYLLQFAQLGSLYMERVLGLQRPRVALLNIGEEESKGTRLVIETHRLLKQADLNFIGNIEGKDLLKGVADVIVTDGFTGNVVLKLAEGLTESIFLSVKESLKRHFLARLFSIFVKPALLEVARQWDYRRVGGAPLLGINGNVIMSHGRSDHLAIKNAIGMAQRAVEERWMGHIASRVSASKGG